MVYIFVSKNLNFAPVEPPSFLKNIRPDNSFIYGG